MNDLSETILNIYIVIENDFVIKFKAKAYESDEGDNEKIKFLKSRVKTDFNSAYGFDAPQNEKGEFMTYSKFSKLEKRGMQFQLFEEMFSSFNVPENPLICVTPVVDGEIIVGS
ncbi:MAG: hypothetical protein ABFS12_00565 [Bacteroidota bacterium]